MEQNLYFEQIDQAYTQLTGTELEQKLKALVSQSRAEYGANSPFYASMLSELGGYYRGQRRYSESEHFFQSAMDILRQQLGEGNPNYATAVNNLAGTHRLMGCYDDAEREFSISLELYGKLLGKKHILYASALNNLSLVYLDRGDLQGASTLLSQTVDILAEHPECIDEFATSLCNLGALQHKLGQLKKAKDTLCKAVKLYESDLGTITPHYHAALNTLGLTYLTAKEYPEACQWLGKSKTAAEKLYGPTHKETLATSEHLRMAQDALEGR